MKKLNSLNLGTVLKREEMKSIAGGIDSNVAPICHCTPTSPGTVTNCMSCEDFCKNKCD